ncbi:WD repeat-containing protein 70 [Clonorchis sinensis]|uniref:WD repeat-containing protein 70 n=1 Tax=Clonorchis sinensis TaxID=79923 RepID=A0A8T1M9B3_CLOSI|nr:WD repeat-containing protein 70 [Clonorchis sinensis]
MGDDEGTDLSSTNEKQPVGVTAKQFDYMKIFEEAHSLAKERNYAKNMEVLSAQIVGPSVSEQSEEVGPPHSRTENDEHEGDAAETKFPPKEIELDTRDPYFLPVTDMLALCHGTKPLTALGVDPSGARVATGGFDFEVKLWDFGGMDSSCRAFKAVRPCEDHQIKHLEFSPSGENLLVISGSAQAHVVTRDGEPVCFTNKGFQYITDPASAKGHTHGLHWGCWHPLDSSRFLTCSQDATLRIWNIEDAETLMNETRIPTHKSVIKPRTSQGRKVIPTTCTFSKDGQVIVAGCQDGSLQMWDTRKLFVNTSQLVREAHPPNTTITCVACSWDGKHLVSRAVDDTVKLWDGRALSKGPVHIVRDLPALFDQSDVVFSPNDHVIAAAVSAPRGDQKAGRITFYRRDNFKLMEEIKPEHGSVIRVAWHHRINQLFCASSDGTANVLYDHQASHHGALLCASRQATAASRRRRLGGSEAYMKPYLLTYNEDSVRSARKAKKLLNQPGMESQIALAAVTAPVHANRQAAATLANQQARARAPVQEEALGNRVGSLHQYMVQQIVLKKDEAEERAEKDIRGAILRHAEEAKSKPFWTKAYLKTQPNPVFYNADEEVKKDDTPVWKKQKLA